MQIPSHENILKERECNETEDFDINDLLLSLGITALFVVPVMLYGLTTKNIRTYSKNKTRTTSPLRCRYCGAPTLEEDVFCTNCWKINPKVQEMLNNNLDKKNISYRPLDNGYKERCPHCKTLYARTSSRHTNMALKLPIICCSNCYGFFVDICYSEWSVLSPIKKFKHFFSIYIWALVAMWFVQVALFSGAGWVIFPDFAIYTAGHFVFCLIWHYTIRRNKVRKSYLRLKQNPEYPQILIDMGYGFMMNKKYHHLCKEPIVSQKDKLKELLKDAFTFD